MSSYDTLENVATTAVSNSSYGEENGEDEDEVVEYRNDDGDGDGDGDGDDDEEQFQRNNRDLLSNASSSSCWRSGEGGVEQEGSRRKWIVALAVGVCLLVIVVAVVIPVDTRERHGSDAHDYIYEYDITRTKIPMPDGVLLDATLVVPRPKEHSGT